MSFATLPRVAVAAVLAAVVTGSAIYYFKASQPEALPSARPSGDGLPEIASIQTAAEAGDSSAQALLGRRYAMGQGVKRNYVEAARWFRAAAEKGNADGQFGLAELLEAGQGLALDANEAATWYRRAADQGHGLAQFGLAAAYEHGRGVPKDQAEAARWYQRAAEQGDSAAQYNLGQRYAMGVGLKADPVQAYRWLRLAGNQGVPDAAQAADGLQAKLSPEQLAEGRRAVDAFVPKPTGRP